MTYDDQNERQIQSLDPAAQIKARQLIERCERVGLNFLIVSAYRSSEEQDDLYAQGRTEPGKIVTYVRGGDSKHNHGVAIDLVPVVLRVAMGQTDPHKKSRYRAVLEWAATPLFKAIGRIAEDINCEWPFPDWDKGHIEYTQGLTLGQLKSGRKPSVMPAKAEWVSELREHLQIAESALKRKAVTEDRKKDLRIFVSRLKRQIERLEE